MSPRRSPTAVLLIAALCLLTGATLASGGEARHTLKLVEIKAYGTEPPVVIDKRLGDLDAILRSMSLKFTRYDHVNTVARPISDQPMTFDVQGGRMLEATRQKTGDPMTVEIALYESPEAYKNKTATLRNTIRKRASGKPFVISQPYDDKMLILAISIREARGR